MSRTKETILTKVKDSKNATSHDAIALESMKRYAAPYKAECKRLREANKVLERDNCMMQDLLNIYRANFDISDLKPPTNEKPYFA